MLQECRCSECNKLLGKIEGRAEIVCTRCKVLNAFDVPDQPRKEIETKMYSDQWKAFREAMQLGEMERNQTLTTSEFVGAARKVLELPNHPYEIVDMSTYK